MTKLVATFIAYQTANTERDLKHKAVIQGKPKQTKPLQSKLKLFKPNTHPTKKQKKFKTTVCPYTL